MTDYGSIGGIAAFNSTEGALDSCVSGNWFVLNRSEAIGVGTGGVIGMNESEKSLTHLINGAFVGRQVSANRYHTGKPGEEGQTNRFAGGIIGNQNTSTGNTWTIEDCINFGTVYCYRSHYSGGIIGQWTSSGGTIRDCRNYGNLQTSLQYSWSGASGGIVAQLYYAYEGNEYNIIGCENHGNLYMRKGASMSSDSYGANDSAGILGNVTTYKVDTEEKGQEYTIRILDCVNGPDVEIYSSSMASGIFGFLSCDNVVNQNGSEVKISTAKVKIQVERCRNFAKVLKGRQFAGGIFGARYTNRGWSNTIVNDCYSVDLDNQYYSPVGNPIYSNGNNHDGSPADITDPDNYKNNFFINARGSKILSADYGFYYDTFMLGKSDAQGNVVSQGEGQKKVKVSRRTSGFWNQYIQNIHAVAVEKNADKSGKTYKLGDIITYTLDVTQQIEKAIAKNVVITDTILTEGVKLQKNSVILLNENGEKIPDAKITVQGNSYTIHAGEFLEGPESGQKYTVEYQVAITDESVIGKEIENEVVVCSENAEEVKDRETVKVEEEPKPEPGEPKVEEPTPEEPKVEEPKVEEPKVEEPQIPVTPAVTSAKSLKASTVKTGDVANITGIILILILSCTVIVLCGTMNAWRKAKKHHKKH